LYNFSVSAAPSKARRTRRRGALIGEELPALLAALVYVGRENLAASAAPSRTRGHALCAAR
jgi:hypothetical protein